MESNSSSSDKPTKGTSMIQQLHLYDLPLKLFACLQKLWQGRPHPLAYIQRQWHTFALVILYIFFRPTFEKHIAPLFAQFDPSPVSTYIWFGLIIATICYTIILIRRRYVLSEGGGLWALVTLLGWWYYRFKGIPNYEVTKIPAEWTSQYISNIDLLYIDLLLVIGGCIIVVQVFSCARSLGSCLRRLWKRKQANRDAGIEGFTPDYPASPEDTDLLGRSEKAFDLTKKIFHTDTSKAAFTLGLTAPWGAGKTSFMLAMQKHLRENYRKKIILIEFNPWMYRKAPNLTQIFFEELSRALAPYSSALASGFMQYVDYILSKENNTWIQLGARLLPQGFKAKSTSEQYEFLNKEIGKLGKKIIIFIDDVDRLDSEELTELFCLVRNISSFPSMSYILAYDKEYVATQLQNKFNEHTYRYMEKIVQAEYPLAKITPEQLEEALREELKRIGYGNLWKPIKNSSFQLSSHLPTLRVIKQICNTLSSRRKELEGNIALSDWFIIEVIRIQYPRLFDFLRENYSRVFYIQGDKRSIILKEVKEHEKSRKEEPLADHPSYGYEIDFYKHISEHHESLQIKSVGLVIELLTLVWDEARDAEVPQANHGDYIGRYFYGTLCASEIDETEFQEHITLPFEEIKKYVKQKLSLMQEQDLSRKIKRKKADSKEMAEKLLSTVFYLASSKLLFTRIEFDNQVNKLNRYLNWEDRKSKLMEIFEQSDIRLGVLLYLIMATQYVEEPSFSPEGEELTTLPFPAEELEDIKVRLFIKHLEKHKSHDLGFCYLLWRECRTFKLTGQQDRWGKPLLNPVVRHPQMDKEMKQAIQENLEAVIPCFIAPCPPPQQNVYTLLLPEPIWGIYPNESLENESFCDFINQQDGDSSPVIEEFQKFLKRWEENKDRVQYYNNDGYDNPISVHVQFDFEHIVPRGVEALFSEKQCQPEW